MTRARKLSAKVLLVAVVALGLLTAAYAMDGTKTYAYLPNHSVYFYDVAEGYAWAHREVDTLAMNGVIKGSGEHLFFPNRAITRAEFIVMLDRAYGMSAALDRGAVTSKGSFADVPNGAYYSKAVQAAKAFGVATGTKDGKFLPEQYMTRQDAMVFLKRTIDCTQLQLPAGSVNGFSDSNGVSGYARDSVGSLVSAKVIGGTNGRLNPRKNVTRAEMAVMLYRALHLEKNGERLMYTKRDDIVNVCIGAYTYSDVVIENYRPGGRYRDLMRYSKLRQENGKMYITLEENQVINQTGTYENGQITIGGTTYPVAYNCIAIDVTPPYHQMSGPISTDSVYRYCYPSVVNGEVTVIYYSKS